MKLRRKTVIITGAAQGIGEETALLFAREGANVVATDINKEKLLELEVKLKEITNDFLIMSHDISSVEEWDKVIDGTIKKFGSIDVLFNNAGIFILKKLIDTTLDDWNKIFATNVTGTFIGLKKVLPIMMQQKSGSIINQSSTAGLRGAPNVAAYGTSKGAICMLSKHAAMESAKYNIRVNTILPGFVDTNMMKYRGEHDNTSQEDSGKKVPLGRIGKTSEVANTVLFLASDDSSFTTGSEFVIDGGRSVGTPL